MSHTSAWSTTTVLAPLPLGVLFVSLGAVAGLGIAYWSQIGWFMLACALVCALLAVPFLAARLRIDDAGVSAASVLGVPRVRIRPEEITGVEVARVDPLGDYLGWGWRSDRRTQGFVLRAGPALIIQRAAGPAIVFTTPEAVAAAAQIRPLASG